MRFDAIADGSSVFFDANVLVYHFTADSKYGVACTGLLQRVANRGLVGFVSSHVLNDLAHRLMTYEAMNRLGWPPTSLAARLRRHHVEIPDLALYRQAIAAVPGFGMNVVAVTQALIESAVTFSERHELLMGDALIVATMQAYGLTNLASNDADFDRVPAVTRFAPA